MNLKPKDLLNRSRSNSTGSKNTDFELMKLLTVNPTLTEWEARKKLGLPLPEEFPPPPGERQEDYYLLGNAV